MTFIILFAVRKVFRGNLALLDVVFLTGAYLVDGVKVFDLAFNSIFNNNLPIFQLLMIISKMTRIWVLERMFVLRRLLLPLVGCVLPRAHFVFFEDRQLTRNRSFHVLQLRWLCTTSLYGCLEW